MASTTNKTSLSKRIITSTLKYLPSLRPFKNVGCKGSSATSSSTEGLSSDSLDGNSDELSRFLIVQSQLSSFYKERQNQIALGQIKTKSLPLIMELPLLKIDKMLIKDIIPTFLSLLALITLIDCGISIDGLPLPLLGDDVMGNKQYSPSPLLDAFYAKHLHFTFLPKNQQNSLNDSRGKQLLTTLKAHLQSLALMHMYQTYTVILLQILRDHSLNGEWFLAQNLLTLTKGLTNTEKYKKRVPSSLQARLHYYKSLTLAHHGDRNEEARSEVIMAMRLSPHGKLSVGFEQHLQRLSLVIDLLLMDIPPRSIFRLPKMEKMLISGGYLDLCRAVRIGDYPAYKQLLIDKAAIFSSDSMTVLVGLLERSVLASGLKRITKAYGRIRLYDVCSKLSLSSLESCLEMIKSSIEDGGLPNCHIENESSSTLLDDICLVVEEEPLQYGTSEPTKAFIQRITLLTELSKHCQVSMQYPEEDEEKNFGNNSFKKSSSNDGGEGDESGAADIDEEYEMMEDEVDDYMED